MHRAAPVCFLLLLSATPGYGWVPVDCQARLAELNGLKPPGTPQISEMWSAHEQAVRAATPGSALYAPNPYPTTENAVVEDFAYAFRALISGEEASPTRPPEEALIERGLANGSLGFEIVRVENWMLSRCSLRRAKPFYHLVRVFSNHREVGRAALLASGLWARFRTYPEGSGVPLPNLDQAALRLAERLDSGQFSEQPQWVALDGLRGCGPLDPCLAVGTASRFVLETPDGSLFEIARDGAWLSVSDWRQEARTSLRPLEPPDEPLVSIGFAWARARPIDDPPR